MEVAITRSVFRRSSVSPNPRTSAASSLSWPRMTPAGSPARPFEWTVAQSFEAHREPQMEINMTKTTPEQNKALVLEAFDTLFNKRDYEAAAKFWSDTYIQHSAHIEPGRDGLFNLIRATPITLRYEHQLIVAEGDYVIVHGRFSRTSR